MNEIKVGIIYNKDLPLYFGRRLFTMLGEAEDAGRLPKHLHRLEIVDIAEAVKVLRKFKPDFVKKDSTVLAIIAVTVGDAENPQVMSVWGTSKPITEEWDDYYKAPVMLLELITAAQEMYKESIKYN